jgi:pimeloyl-ACP methyl ester carboxylesterase
MMPEQSLDKQPLGKRLLGRLGWGGAAALLALAASAAANYALAKRAERRNPPEGSFVTVDGVRLHYVERGPGEHGPGEHGPGEHGPGEHGPGERGPGERGPGEHDNRPAVVLLHGVGGMTREMAASGIIAALAADHRVIAFDRPGFGYSERPRGRIWTPAAQAALLRDALDRLGVTRPVIVGHSWGTLVALEMALRDPDRTAGLVLLSGYFFPTLRLDVALLFWPAVPVVGDILRYAVSPWFSRLLKPLAYKLLFAPAPVTQSFAEEVPSELIFRPWQLRSAAAEVALLIPGAAALAGRYGELRMPTAIVAGPGDRIVNFERHSARLYQALPRSTLRSLPRTGHMIHHSAPPQIVSVISDLVRTTRLAPTGSGTQARTEP